MTATAEPPNVRGATGGRLARAPDAHQALAAPRQVVLPPGPRYLKASADWKGDVERLLRQALFVVVVLPPGKAFTQSVRWEIEQCRRLGLLGRLLLVARPQTCGAGTPRERRWRSSFPATLASWTGCWRRAWSRPAR